MIHAFAETGATLTFDNIFNALCALNELNSIQREQIHQLQKARDQLASERKSERDFVRRRRKEREGLVCDLEEAELCKHKIRRTA